MLYAFQQPLRYKSCSYAHRILHSNQTIRSSIAIVSPKVWAVRCCVCTIWIEHGRAKIVLVIRCVLKLRLHQIHQFLCNSKWRKCPFSTAKNHSISNAERKIKRQKKKKPRRRCANSKANRHKVKERRKKPNAHNLVNGHVFILHTR